MNELEFLNNYMEFTNSATSQYATCELIEQELIKQGFLLLDSFNNIKKGGKYFVKSFESTIFAFNIGKDVDLNDMNMIICASHTDTPGFSIKSNPMMKNGKYVKLNVESYGGGILNTWMDRPLGISGYVVVKTKDIFNPRIINYTSKNPVCVIPNLAIHFNREVNKGVELNKQKDMLPLLGLSKEPIDEMYLVKAIAGELDIAYEDIIDYQLNLYNCDKAMVIGYEGDILLAPRIDNLASVFTSLKALCDSDNDKKICMAAFFDNEEVGSRTKQGAASITLNKVVEGIFKTLGCVDGFKALKGVFLLSMDGAHGIHPNHGDRYDPTNSIYLNDGVVIKRAVSQSYSTDAVSSAILKEICEKSNIPYKLFYNKSDMPGGGTLGSIASAMLPVRVADVGIPMLAMHSALEMTGSKDIYNLYRLAVQLYNYI